jgi:hypothetical protein
VYWVNFKVNRTHNLICTQKVLSHAIAATLFAATASVVCAAEFPSRAEAREAVTAYFLSGDEPNVEAANWASEKEFNVGVHYMGSSEDNFARYACSVLAKHGVGAGTIVYVIDINTMSLAPKQWDVVGEAVCKK